MGAKLVWILTLVSVISSSIPARSQMAQDPANFSNKIDVAGAATGQIKLSSEEEQEVKNYLGLPTQETLEIMFLLKNLYIQMLNAEKKMGEEALIKVIQTAKDSEKIKFEDERIGKAEPDIIDVGYGKKPVILTKVRHNGLKMTTVFFNANEIDMEELARFEIADRQNKLDTYEPFRLMTPDQRDLEIKYRRAFIAEFKTLWVGVLMSAWNPAFKYKPMNDPDDEQAAEELEKSISDEEVRSEVHEVLNLPIQEVAKKNWFQEKIDKGYDVWVNMKDATSAKWLQLAVEEKQKRSAKSANETIMLVGMNAQDGQILGIQQKERQPKTSLGYWKDYWTNIWRTPHYDRELWRNSKGIGKMRVLITGDYGLGLGFGIALGGLSWMVASHLPNSIPHGLTPFSVGLVSFSWSLFFGVFSKTWQRYTYRGNEFVRFLKNWSTGIGQSYQFNLMSAQTLNIVDSMGGWNDQAIKAHVDIFTNQSIKSSSKTSLQEVPRFRADTKESAGTIKIPYVKFVGPFELNQFISFEATETTFNLGKYIQRGYDKLARLTGAEEDDQKVLEDIFSFTLPDIKIKLPWFEMTGGKIDLAKYPKKLAQTVSIEPRKEADWEKYFKIPGFRIKVPNMVTHEVDPKTGQNKRLAIETSIPRKNLEGQKPQLLTTPIGLLSRFGYMVAGVPLGHILYALLGPLGEISQIRYKTQYTEMMAERYGEKDAKVKRLRTMVAQEREKWDDMTLNKNIDRALNTKFLQKINYLTLPSAIMLMPSNIDVTDPSFYGYAAATLVAAFPTQIAKKINSYVGSLFQKGNANKLRPIMFPLAAMFLPDLTQNPDILVPAMLGTAFPELTFIPLGKAIGKTTAYYLRVGPAVLGAAKDMGIWLAQKTAYYTTNLPDDTEQSAATTRAENINNQARESAPLVCEKLFAH